MGQGTSVNDYGIPFAGPEPGRTVAEFDGKRLFALRRARWVTQEALGLEAAKFAVQGVRKRISRGAVGHLERIDPETGEPVRRPTVPTVVRLALALGVRPSDLLALPYRADIPPEELLALRDKQSAEAEAETRRAAADEEQETGREPLSAFFREPA